MQKEDKIKRTLLEVLSKLEMPHHMGEAETKDLVKDTRKLEIEIEYFPA